MERRFRSRYGRAAVVRAAVLVFLLAAALIAAVVFALDHNARQSNRQQAVTELASVARVAGSKVSTIRANLRVRVSELAGSNALQQAVLAGRGARIAQIAREHDAKVVTRGRAYGATTARGGLAATATIASGARRLARVTIAVPLDASLLRVLEAATPMPAHAALLLVRHGRVLAGGPAGARVDAGRERLELGSAAFEARQTPLGASGVSVLAIEPVAAVDARTVPYRRRLLLVAALTLALAAGLATRLARPVARVLGDLARLSRQAQTDGLTGVANRRTLDERLDDEVDHARRLGVSVSFVIADVDNFKSINDRYGHPTGDEVLRAVARAFADAVRALDLVGRFGGEEFAAVLPGTELAGARRLAERVRAAVEELRVVAPSGEIIEVTASFGAASFPTHGTVEALVAAADASLYEAKRSGKNCVVTATAKKKRAAASGGEGVVPA